MTAEGVGREPAGESSEAPDTACVVPYCRRYGRADCPYPTHPRLAAPVDLAAALRASLDASDRSGVRRDR